MPRHVNLIVLHCSASPNDRTLFEGNDYRSPLFRTPAQVIDRWHCERGFHRTDEWRRRQESRLGCIGYHFVIARNGALFNGRHLDEVCAHARGWNSNSIGICLVGTDQFTDHQWAQLEATVRSLCARYGIPLEPAEVYVDATRKGQVRRAGVIGHGKLPGHAKTCPGFDVVAWLKGLKK